MKKENLHEYIAASSGVAIGTALNFLGERDAYTIFQHLALGGLMSIGVGIISYGISQKARTQKLFNSYYDARDFMLGILATEAVFKGLESLV